MSRAARAALSLAVTLGACSPPAQEAKSPPSTGPTASPPAATAAPAAADMRSRARQVPVAFPATGLIRQQWTLADNRKTCAPLAFHALGASAATPRAAHFSGGWAVAWDRPGLRSAFGLAGPAILASDSAPSSEQRARLAAQWPLFRELPQLPPPAFAGYGVEGAAPYPESNPDGRGLNSLAYLRVGGQTCTYNVWSRLGRAHLEFLLRHLTMLEQD